LSSELANHFFSFNNPFFLGMVFTFLMVLATIYIVIKIVLPLHRDNVLKTQKYLLQKAELMALFSEMDPNPLIRIDNNRMIIHTNDSSRQCFGISMDETTNIDQIIPDMKKYNTNDKNKCIIYSNGSVYIVNIVPDPNHEYANLYFNEITQLKEYEASLEEYKRRLKMMTERLDRENEVLKKEISYELHDNICQQLTALNMEISNGNMDKKNLLNNVNRIHSHVRTLSRDLKPVNIEIVGLRIGLQVLIENVSNKSNIKGKYQYVGREEQLSSLLSNSVFRIVQEALNNIVVHSQAAEYEVKLELKDDKIVLIITDDGVGIPEEYNKPDNYVKYGIGLYNIRERVERLSGTYKIISNEETGTLIAITLPIIRE